MLTPAQVIPFLTHDDPLVRRQAITYFRDCPDPGPMTAEHYWAAIDKLGGVGKAARSFVVSLPGVPQTDASVARTLAELADATERDDIYDLRRTLRELPFDVLVRNRQAILACPDVGDDLAAFLRRRLDLVDISADDSWDRLMALGRGAADTDETDDDTVAAEDEEAELLVEAAARHIDAVAAPALATLDDVAAASDWRELLAVRVLGAGRHGPAAGPLAAKLLVDDDYLRDEAVAALGEIGTPSVVAELVALAPGRPDDVRAFLDEPLGRIKLPQSEAALLRLLAAESDDELRGRLLYALCDLGSLAGLDAARQYIVADPDHPESLDLCEALIATAAMHGQTLQEEPRWRSRLAARDARVAKRTKQFDGDDLGAFVAAMAERVPGIGGLDDDDGGAGGPIDPLPPPPVVPGEYDPYARIEPLRNTGPKVGRNDPCPCGSGKKYKKCCGAAA